MPNYIDLTGKTIGNIQVIKRAENAKSGEAKFLCECLKCKEEFEASGNHLRQGRHQACGRHTGRFFDLTGKVIDNIEVIKKIENAKNGSARFFCKCLKCKEEFEAYGSDLRRGENLACGRHTQKSMDLTGKIIGNIQIIKRVENKKDNGYAYYLCKCLKCKKEFVAPRHQLNQGQHQSCDHHVKEAIDLTGKTIGNIKVIRRVENDRHNHLRFLCKCLKCKEEFEILANDLRQGHHQICGRHTWDSSTTKYWLYRAEKNL